jgi:arylsulfatase A-like enzyme
MASKPHLILLTASQLRCDVLGCFGGVGLPGRTAMGEAFPLLGETPASNEASGFHLLTRAPGDLDNGLVDTGSMGPPDDESAQDLPSVTPQLDKLAANANVFERHYTNCPLTIPSRVSMLSGLHTHQHRALISGWLAGERDAGVMQPTVKLLPRRLAEAGYRVVHAGAQQVRAPEGVDVWEGVDIIGPTAPVSFYRELSRRGLYLGDPSAFQEPVVDVQAGRNVVYHATGTRIAPFPLREEYHYDHVVAQRVCDMISKLDPEKPTALFVNLWLPHPPLWVPKNWSSIIHHSDVKLPANVGKWYVGQPVSQLQNLTGQLGAHVSMDRWQRIWSSYLGLTGMLDACLGKVIAAITQRGMMESSLLVFTSDHGEMLGSHSLFGKNCMYEESTRVPLILRMPGQSRGRRIGELTDHIDLHATLLDALGLDPETDSRGTGFLSLATGGGVNGAGKTHVFAAYDGNGGRGFAQRMARSRTHKLIHNIGDRPELYDLIDDVGETSNLAGRDETRDVEIALAEQLNSWMDSVGDDQPRCPVPVTPQRATS